MNGTDESAWSQQSVSKFLWKLLSREKSKAWDLSILFRNHDSLSAGPPTRKITYNILSFQKTPSSFHAIFEFIFRLSLESDFMSYISLCELNTVDNSRSGHSSEFTCLRRQSTADSSYSRWKGVALAFFPLLFEKAEYRWELGKIALDLGGFDHR